MALRLRLAAQAKRDAGRILGFIAMENPTAARKLAEALERGLLRLLDYPLSSPLAPNKVKQEVRQLFLSPCRVLYRVCGQTVFILGILRCEQNVPETPLEDS